MLLCPFTKVEPETLPRPWLLFFMQQGAATILSGVGRRDLRKLWRLDRVLHILVEIDK